MTKIRQSALFLMKFSVSAVLLFILIQKAGPGKIIAVIGQIDSRSLIAAFCCYAAIIFVSAFRLHRLIFPILPLKSVLSISAIGYFFNMFLPSGISGDVARAYYIRLEKGFAERRGVVHVVAPLIMEKYFGLAAVFAIGVIVLPFVVGLYEKDKTANIIQAAVLLAAVCLAGPVFLRFGLFKKNRFVADFYRYIDSFKDNRKTAVVFFYSALIQIISICAIFLISDGMGLDVSFFHYVIIVPMINILTILPVALGGIGLREGAFVFFLSTLGIPAHAAVTLSLVSFVLSVMAGLIGLCEYLRYKTRSSVHKC